MNNLKIGTRIKAISPVDGYDCLIGKRGRVCEVKQHGSIGLVFDEPFDGGHTCDGNCKAGYGRYSKLTSCEFIIENTKEKEFYKSIV